MDIVLMCLAVAGLVFFSPSENGYIIDRLDNSPDTLDGNEEESMV